MGYPQEFLAGAIVRQSNAFDTAEVLTAAAAAYGSYVCHYPLSVHGMTFQLTTATADLTNSVIELQRVTVGDVTTSIVLGTIATGTAIGKICRKNCSAFQLVTGDKLQFNHKTQGGLGGTPAGAGFYGFLASLEPESTGNLTNHLAF